MPDSSRGAAAVSWIALVLSVAALGIGLFVMLKPQATTNNAAAVPANTANVSNEPANAPASSNTTTKAPAAAEVSTYTNTDYGFSLEYPTDWVGASTSGYPAGSTGPNTNPDSITIGSRALRLQEPPTGTFQGVSIGVFKEGYQLPCEDAACENAQTLSVSTDLTYFVRVMQGLLPDEIFSTSVKETRTVGGVTAVRFLTDGVYTPWTLKTGSTFIVFTSLQGNDVSDADFTESLELILSSFKFTT